MYLIFYHRNALIVSMIISIILLHILNIKKKKDSLWVIPFGIGILPFVSLLLGALHSVFNGSGLVGDTGGISSGIFVIIASLGIAWYIYIPAVFLVIFSVYKMFKKEDN